MYTNIDTTMGLNPMSDLLHENDDKLPTSFTTLLFLRILETVMLKNIFAFGDTFWLQLTGMAMGTPTACAYATITYRHYENTVIFPTFKRNYYIIEDILMISLEYGYPKRMSQLSPGITSKNK
jgi:hypothetical protein